MYTLYVIPGSHACRSAMLMLEHKQVPYRRVDIVTLLHPVVVRLHGFDAGGQTRTAGARRTLALRMGDRLGTVPALAADGQRVSTNREIARFLDDRHPEPSLFPADPGQRRAVEEAERWANDTLQMAARRIALAWALRDPAAIEPLGRRRPDGLSPLPARARAAPDHPDDRPPRVRRRPRRGARAPRRPSRDARPDRRLDRRRGPRRSAAERRGLHGRAQPGADPLPPRRPAPVRGPPGPRARRPAPARAGPPNPPPPPQTTPRHPPPTPPHPPTPHPPPPHHPNPAPATAPPGPPTPPPPPPPTPTTPGDHQPEATNRPATRTPGNHPGKGRPARAGKTLRPRRARRGGRATAAANRRRRRRARSSRRSRCPA